MPVCLHENALSVTTDVSARPEFADRRRILIIGVVPYNDWFAIDFTLAELKTLRKKQASAYRDPSFDELYTIPTLQAGESCVSELVVSKSGLVGAI